MTMLILDPADQARILERRRECGGDRSDEVWDGVYVMAPLANNEHQQIISRLTHCFEVVVSIAGRGIVQPGANVSDLAEDWEHNYRCPDVVVYLHTTAAVDHGTHWQGGPDFAVEVVSRHDRSRRKFEFYARIGLRELLIVDRFPWMLELYRLNNANEFDLVGRSTVEQPASLAGQVLPLSFRLQAGEKRPGIVIAHTDGVQTWSA